MLSVSLFDTPSWLRRKLFLQNYSLIQNRFFLCTYYPCVYPTTILILFLLQYLCDKVCYDKIEATFLFSEQLILFDIDLFIYDQISRCVLELITRTDSPIIRRRSNSLKLVRFFKSVLFDRNPLYMLSGKKTFCNMYFLS